MRVAISFTDYEKPFRVSVRSFRVVSECFIDRQKWNIGIREPFSGIDGLFIGFAKYSDGIKVPFDEASKSFSVCAGWNIDRHGCFNVSHNTFNGVYLLFNDI